MNDLDWDAEFDFVTGLNDCSDKLMRGSPTAATKKARKDVERRLKPLKKLES